MLKSGYVVEYVNLSERNVQKTFLFTGFFEKVEKVVKNRPKSEKSSKISREKSMNILRPYKIFFFVNLQNFTWQFFFVKKKIFKKPDFEISLKFIQNGLVDVNYGLLNVIKLH